MALRDTLCTLRTDELLLKRPISGACFEFWLNRYQTTIQTLLSTSLAGAGLYFVLKQLKALAAQNEMTRVALERDSLERAAARRMTIARAMVALSRVQSHATGLQVGLERGMTDGKFNVTSDSLLESSAQSREHSLDVFPALESPEIENLWHKIEDAEQAAGSYVCLRAAGWSVDVLQSAMPWHKLQDDSSALEHLKALSLDINRLRDALATARRSSFSAAQSGSNGNP